MFGSIATALVGSASSFPPSFCLSLSLLLGKETECLRKIRGPWAGLSQLSVKLCAAALYPKVIGLLSAICYCILVLLVGVLQACFGKEKEIGCSLSLWASCKYKTEAFEPHICLRERGEGVAAVWSAKVTYIIHMRSTEISNICVFSLPLQITDRTESLNRSIKKRYLQGPCGIRVKGVPCSKLLKLSHLPEASGCCLILFLFSPVTA